MANKRKALNIADANLWYLVGLITSDGCLSKDRRHIDITSKDYEFLYSIKNQFGFPNKICNKFNSSGDLNYHFQLANRSLYEFLLSIGLTPRKSLIIKAINVPVNYFCDFLRGIIDGDSSIRRWLHTSNKKEQWSSRVYSPSTTFTEWLRGSIERIFRVKGQIHRDRRDYPRADLFVLKYGKIAAKVILNRCYYKNALALGRKVKLAKACCLSQSGWR